MAVLFQGAYYRVLDASGNPVNNAKIHTYEAGTTTPKATYTTQAGNVENANPVRTNSAGVAVIWLGSGSYKFVVTDENDAALPDGTLDNFSAPASAVDLAASTGSDLVGYIQTGTGVVAQTVQDKLREYVSVEDFGADRTGATGSGTAINLALASGARIVRASGTYLVDADLLLPDNVVFDCRGAHFKASADSRTMIKSTGTPSSYYSQIIGGLWDGNGKASVTAMDLSNMRINAGVFSPRWKNCNIGLIARTGCFGMVIDNPGAEVVKYPIQVIANGSTLVVRNPSLDNSVSMGGDGTGIGIDIRAGAGDNIGVRVQGGYVQGFATGIKDAGIKTIVSDVYLEVCSDADIEGASARASQYRAIQHYGPSGAAGYKLRSCDGVVVFDPTMASGARTALYDVDNTNSNCVEFRAGSNASLNAPTGTLTYLGQIPKQESGTFTPVVVGSGTAGTGTYSTQSGTYARTGNIVTFSLTVTWSGHTGSGNITVTGLPSSLAPSSFTARRMFTAALVDDPITGPVVFGYLTGTSSTIGLAQHTAAGAESLVPLGTSATLHISGSFVM